MKIVVSSDHGGFEVKKLLIEHLCRLGYEVIDKGTYSNEPASWSENGLKAALSIKNKEAEVGFTICKSGIGVMIAANKVKGVYCGLAYNDEVSFLSKEHDGCNMLAFAAAYMSTDDIIKRADLFLKATFQGGRHEIRLNQLKEYEEENM